MSSSSPLFLSWCYTELGHTQGDEYHFQDATKLSEKIKQNPDDPLVENASRLVTSLYIQSWSLRSSMEEDRKVLH